MAPEKGNGLGKTGLQALVVLCTPERREVPSLWPVPRLEHFLDQEEQEDTEGSNKGPQG